MRSRRVPNGRLRALLAEAGWTGEVLAQAVNALGAEAGLVLRYHRPAVSHWLSGMRPRPPVPELVAEAFSRRLGRTVSVEATGLAKPAAAASRHAQETWWVKNPAEWLVELAGHGPRQSMRAADKVYSLADLSVPDWTDLIAFQAGRPSGSASRVGHAEVNAARMMLRLFSTSDSTFGAGQGRQAMATYLATTIAPWLSAAVSTAVRRDLFSVAAQLAYLCGFMSFDDQLHGVAQNYYRVGLRLAAEAEDPVSYAVVLRGLSVQARVLGHLGQAVELADAAVRAVQGRASLPTKAFLLGQLAVANAAVGEGRAARAGMAETEETLGRSAANTTPVGSFHPAALFHQRAAVAACLGDHSGAMAALRTSIRHRPAVERRSRAITMARLAELQLAHGELEAACATWHDFLNEYPHLSSRRVDAAFANLRASIRSHESRPIARELGLRASAIAAVHGHGR